jgi:membrane-associated PAP2 superfamily phosphatase
MGRTGLFIALALAIVVGGIFAIWPELDLKIASIFVKSDFRPEFTFGLRLHPVVWWLREIGLWISAIVVAPAVAAIVWKLIRPRDPMLIPGRAAILLIVTLALGPGLVVNLGLKEYWDRPRPVDVTQFGGNERFVPWWDPRGDCDKNCSFVSGDVSGAYWTLAAAAVAPIAWQPLAYAGALLFGSTMGLLRMMAGGHFISDVFFAGFFVFIIIWLCYALLYRWPSTRTTDKAVEQSIERVASWPSRLFSSRRPAQNARPRKSGTPRRRNAKRRAMR